jgi:hypothetical protein
MQQLQTVINATELWQHTRRKKKEASRGAMATRPVSTVVRSCGFSASHYFLFVAIGMNCLGTMASWAQESSSIAKQAQNPIANLISVPLENDFDPQTGGQLCAGGETRRTLPLVERLEFNYADNHTHHPGAGPHAECEWSERFGGCGVIAIPLARESWPCNLGRWAGDFHPNRHRRYSRDKKTQRWSRLVVLRS